MSCGSKTCDRSRVSCGTYALLAIASILLTGCGLGSERKKPLEMQAEKLQQEKADLAGRLEQCKIKNAQLQQQVKGLTALPGGGEYAYKLTGIKIAGYTGFYDKDEDGKREKLLVYVQPVDEEGDIIKAAGTVSVQLWNLNGPGDQALLGQWEVQPLELRKLWFSALISSYRLAFDAPITPELLAQPLTVKVAFTDYLTAQVFHRQHVVKPRPE